MQIDIVKYLLNRPVLQGRLMTWAIKLSAYELTYVPLRAIKGQAVADFVAQHPSIEVVDPFEEINQCINLKPWVLTIDGSKTKKGPGAGVTLIGPTGQNWKFMCQLQSNCSYNQAEYGVLIMGLRILASMKVQCIQIMGDS